MKIGVFVGRMSPLHYGHQRIIDKMIEDCGIEYCIVFIGSSVSPVTWRNLFSYTTRQRWVKRLYPNLRVIGIPDTETNDIYAWGTMLDDYIAAIFPKASSVVYYGGSEKDTQFYILGIGGKYKKEIVVLDRSITNISATKIRYMLEKDKSIKGLVDELIIEDVIAMFGYSYSLAIKKKIEKLYNQ